MTQDRGATRKGRDPRRGVVDGSEEGRLREIIDHVADGIVIVSTTGAVRFVNPAAEALFDRPADRLLDRDFGFPLVPSGTAEIDVVRRDGDTRVAELRVVPMEWDGEPALLVSLRDITDRREAEERLRQLLQEQTARWRAEAEERRARFLADASALLDSSLDYQVVLDQLARLIVAPQSELPRRRPNEPPVPRMADWCVIDVVEPGTGKLDRIAAAHHDAERAGLMDELGRRFPPDPDRGYPGAVALGRGEPLLLEDITEEQLETLTHSAEHAALLRRLGVKSVMAVPLVAHGERLGVVIFACADRAYDPSDLTLATELAQRAALSIANARLYREAERARATADTANRAKSDFLAVMSHELRTPLNAILGYTDLLVAGISGPLNSLQQEQLSRVDHSARHLLQIVEEILSFARIEAGREELHPSRVELAELAREASAMVRPLADRKGLTFHLDLSEPLPPLTTDAGKVRQILLNLLSNAIKFTERGEVRLRARREAGEYLIEVSDTGIGIPAEHMGHIFEPFWQVEQSARRTAGGTGLGLSVAFQLTGLLGGTLGATSEPNRGTTFRLRLPADPAAVDPGGGRAAAGGDGAGSGT